MKMLFMSLKKRGLSFPETAKALNIVPVSISYEYDPCDALKADELQAKESQGGYEKSQYEDIDSIVRGIVGYKGDVHVAFGEPLTDEYESAEDLADAIDQAVIGNYHLHASNLLAAEQNLEQIPTSKADGFNSRLAEVSADSRSWFVAQYANPVLRKQQLEQR